MSGVYVGHVLELSAGQVKIGVPGVGEFTFQHQGWEEVGHGTVWVRFEGGDVRCPQIRPRHDRDPEGARQPLDEKWIPFRPSFGGGIPLPPEQRAENARRLHDAALEDLDRHDIEEMRRRSTAAGASLPMHDDTSEIHELDRPETDIQELRL